MTLFNKGLELERELSNRLLKSPNSVEIGFLIIDILFMHCYLTAKIVINGIFLYFYHEKKD